MWNKCDKICRKTNLSDSSKYKLFNNPLSFLARSFRLSLNCKILSKSSLSGL